MEKMTMVAFRNEVKELSGLSKKEVGQVLAAIEVVVLDGLRKGVSVPLSSLGTLWPQHKEARKGHNPKTGAPIDIQEKIVVKFRPALVVREAVNPK